MKTRIVHLVYLCIIEQISRLGLTGKGTIDISESSNWKKKIMTSNGKNIIVWTLELRDDDFYE